MIFGEFIEDLFYWGWQLAPYQEVLYWSMWALIPSFLVSIYRIYRNQPAEESPWFVATLLNLITVFIISLKISHLALLFGIFLSLEILYLWVISHLLTYEK